MILTYIDITSLGRDPSNNGAILAVGLILVGRYFGYDYLIGSEKMVEAFHFERIEMEWL